MTHEELEKLVVDLIKAIQHASTYDRWNIGFQFVHQFLREHPEYIQELTDEALAAKQGYGPLQTCTVCNGVGYVESIGEYETTYEINGEEMRACPLCLGAGKRRDRIPCAEIHQPAKKS